MSRKGYPLDEGADMGGGGGNAGVRFHKAHYLKAEAFGKVRPAVMVGDDAGAMIGGCLPKPALQRPVHAIQKGCPVLTEAVGIARGEAAECLEDIGGDGARIGGVKPVVGIPEAVDVSRRSPRAWDLSLQKRDISGGIEMTLAPGEKTRVTRSLQESPGPGLVVEPDPDKELRSFQLDKMARPDLEVVGVLVTGRDALHIHAVSTDGLDEGLEIGSGGHHADLFRCLGDR